MKPAKVHMLAYSVVQAMAWAACLALCMEAITSIPKNAKVTIPPDQGVQELEAHLAWARKAKYTTLAQVLSGLLALVKPVVAFLNTKTPGLSKVFATAGPLIAYCQLFAGLEVAHAALGLVRGSPLNAMMQWMGRSHVLFLVIGKVASLQTSPIVGLLLTVWAIAEICRYPYMALLSVRLEVPIVTLVRYTAFLPLYPIGVLAEMWLLYSAIPYASNKNINSISLPNMGNVSFHYPTFLKVLLVVYFPLWLRLYMFLLRQSATKIPAAFSEPAKVPAGKKTK